MKRSFSTVVPAKIIPHSPHQGGNEPAACFLHKRIVEPTEPDGHGEAEEQQEHPDTQRD